ncbi:hypothetical protein LSAT2_019088 [Lamellibrachia satsuma]|nr:hypothetical protein LSAT2_019088 [Lamellibrachia satsuma]
MREPMIGWSKTFVILKVWRDGRWNLDSSSELVHDLCEALLKLKRGDLKTYVQHEQAQCPTERILRSQEAEAKVWNDRRFWNFKVGPEGATLHVRNVSFTIPAGALEKKVIITIVISCKKSDEPKLKDDQRFIGPVVYCLPHGLSFKRPVTLQFNYDLEAVPASSSMQLWYRYV